MSSRFPTEQEMYPGDGNHRECLVRFVDPMAAGSFGTYRIWTTNVDAAADTEEWMRIFALEDVIGNWDSYGNSISQTVLSGGKNMYAYRHPADNRWRLLLWDLDVSLGSDFSLGVSDGLFSCANEPTIQRFYTNAAFLRSYWRAINDAVNGPMLFTNLSPIMAGNYTALSGNNISVVNPNANVFNGLSNWVSGRRVFLTNQLDVKTTIGFSLTNSTASSQSNIVLGGLAPVQIRFIRFGGRSTNEPVAWPTVTNWSLPFVLNAGQNNIQVQGYDWKTNVLDWATNSTSISY